MFQPKESLDRLDIAKRLKKLVKTADDLEKLSPHSFFLDSEPYNDGSYEITTLADWESRLRRELKDCSVNYKQVMRELYDKGNFKEIYGMGNHIRKNFDPAGVAASEQRIIEKNERILIHQKKLFLRWVDELTGEVQPDGDQDAIAYELTYINQRLKINGIEIAKPQFNGVNDLVMEYLMKHPNQRFDKDAIAKAIQTKIKKPLRNIVSELGFKGNKRIFIDAGKAGIMLRNPITYKMLNELKLQHIDEISPLSNR